MMRATRLFRRMAVGLLPLLAALPADAGITWAADPAGTPTPTPAALSTPTPGGCSGSLPACSRAMLSIINNDRAQYGLAPLSIKSAQSTGRSSCVGSYGHSVAMAHTGSIWHFNPKFPRASFPRNICVPYRLAGENVGESGSGNVLYDLQELNRLMMGEPHSRSVCAATLNHACNLLNPNYHSVGIGIVVSNGTTWLTEDFLG